MSLNSQWDLGGNLRKLKSFLRFFMGFFTGLFKNDQSYVIADSCLFNREGLAWRLVKTVQSNLLKVAHSAFYDQAAPSLHTPLSSVEWPHQFLCFFNPDRPNTLPSISFAHLEFQQN